MTPTKKHTPNLSIDNLEEVNKSIHLSDIELNPVLQARAEMRPQTVKDYETAYSNGAKFPPLLVGEINDYKGNSAYLLLDGWHRHQALQNINWQDPIEVRALKIPLGTPIQQLIFIGGRANLTNGLALSAKDKRELFRTYVKGKHNKRGRSYKSYREIAAELLLVKHQTIHTWMKKDFPSIAIQMRLEHKEDGEQIESLATGTGHVLTVMTDLSMKGLGTLALEIIDTAKASDNNVRENISAWVQELTKALNWEAPFTPSSQHKPIKDKVLKYTLKDDTFSG